MAPKQPAGAPPVRVVVEALRKTKHEFEEEVQEALRKKVQERIAHASKVAKKGDGFDGFGTPDPSNQNDDNQVNQGNIVKAIEHIMEGPTPEHIMELVQANNMSIEQRQLLVRLLCDSCAGQGVWTVPDEDL